jgi:hypothetical protein
MTAWRYVKAIMAAAGVINTARCRRACGMALVFTLFDAAYRQPSKAQCSRRISASFRFGSPLVGPI